MNAIDGFVIEPTTGTIPPRIEVWRKHFGEEYQIASVFSRDEAEVVVRAWIAAGDPDPSQYSPAVDLAIERALDACRNA